MEVDKLKYKGITEIELTNVATGETELIRDDNMITNAVAKIFSGNIEGMLYYLGSSGTSFTNNILPICKNAIGGILLFTDPLIEDENNIYAPSDNPCVGYASIDVNATSNVMRGSLNPTESMNLDRGYKFVWDFTTSQANGTISAVALTHKYAGIGYFGDSYNASNKVLQMKFISSSLSGSIANRYIDAVEVNFNENHFYSISMNVDNEICINKVRKCFYEVGLKFTLSEDGDYILDTQVIHPTIFIRTSGSSINCDFYDGQDGYWYGFMVPSNSSGDAVVKWIKISKLDYSFTEGTWTFSNVTFYQVGQRGTSATSPYRYIYSVLRNGYLYVMHYSKTGVYKINVNNSADITWIPFGFTSNMYSAADYSSTYMFLWNDRIMGSDYIINSDDSIIKTTNNNPLNRCCTPLFQEGVYALSFGKNSSSGYSVYKTLWLMTPYLATINNLGSSVIKTADKTMKITYTIMESD